MLAGVSLCPRTLQPAGDGGLVPSEWSLSQGAGSQADWIPVGVVPLPRVASNATPSGMLPSSELRLPSLECGAGSTHRDVVPPTPLPHAHHQPTSEASVRGRCSPSLLALMASGHCHLGPGAGVTLPTCEHSSAGHWGPGSQAVAQAPGSGGVLPQGPQPASMGEGQPWELGLVPRPGTPPHQEPLHPEEGSLGVCHSPPRPREGSPDPSLMLRRGDQGAALCGFPGQAHEKVGVPCPRSSTRRVTQQRQLPGHLPPCELQEPGEARHPGGSGQLDPEDPVCPGVGLAVGRG